MPTIDGKFRISKKDLNEVRQDAAKNGNTVNDINSEDEHLEAILQGIPEDHLKILSDLYSIENEEES